MNLEFSRLCKRKRFLFYSLITIVSIVNSSCRNGEAHYQNEVNYQTDADNMRKNLRDRYPYLNVTQIESKSSEFHARCLMNALTAEECAYHVIAIGLIGEDTPEVRKSVENAIERFKNVGLPKGYDWPDSAEQFRTILEQHPDYVVDHYPGNRLVSMLDLIDECLMRIGVSNLSVEE